MTGMAWSLVYGVFILPLSLLGGCLPLMWLSHSRRQLYLILCCGVMLGAAFFHLMPDAMEITGEMFHWWMAIGVLGLFCVDRLSGRQGFEAAGTHQTERVERVRCHPSGGVRLTAGWLTVFCLSMQAFMSGVGLAGAVQFDVGTQADQGMMLPGLALFLVVILLQPANAFVVSTILGRNGITVRRLALVQVGFAVMVLFGILAFHTTHGIISGDLQSKITGAALGFSSGMFLLIPLADLLPEVQFQYHGRIRLFTVLILGVGLMGAIAML